MAGSFFPPVGYQCTQSITAEILAKRVFTSTDSLSEPFA